MAIELYVDFNQLQVFEGATTYPVIIGLKKNIPNKTFDFLRIEEGRENLNAYLSSPSYQVISIEDLDETNWKFESKSAVAILVKLEKNKPLFEIYGKCYYGIKTGLNEAFITDYFNSLEDNEHLKWV